MAKEYEEEGRHSWRGVSSGIQPLLLLKNLVASLQGFLIHDTIIHFISYADLKMTSPRASNMLHELRSRFNPLSEREALFPPLKKITAVGAFGVKYDEYRFCRAFTSLAVVGIPLAPELEVDCLALDRDGRDFLAETPTSPTDLLIVCFLNNPPRTLQGWLDGVSPHHFLPQVWARAAARSGAKAIYVDGAYPHEISHADFNYPPYALVGHCLGEEASDSFGGFPDSLLIHQDYGRVVEPRSGAGAFAPKRVIPVTPQQHPCSPR